MLFYVSFIRKPYDFFLIRFIHFYSCLYERNAIKNICLKCTRAHWGLKPSNLLLIRVKIKNEVIRDNLSIEKLQNHMINNKLRWYGQIQRMKNNRISKKALNMKWKGECSRCRLRTRWKHELKNVEERDWSGRRLKKKLEFCGEAMFFRRPMRSGNILWW